MVLRPRLSQLDSGQAHLWLLALRLRLSEAILPGRELRGHPDELLPHDPATGVYHHGSASHHDADADELHGILPVAMGRFLLVPPGVELPGLLRLLCHPALHGDIALRDGPDPVRDCHDDHDDQHHDDLRGHHDHRRPGLRQVPMAVVPHRRGNRPVGDRPVELHRLLHLWTSQRQR